MQEVGSLVIQVGSQNDLDGVFATQVVADIELGTELIFDRLPDVIVPPREVGREENNAGILIDNTCLQTAKAAGSLSV